MVEINEKNVAEIERMVAAASSDLEFSTITGGTAAFIEATPAMLAAGASDYVWHVFTRASDGSLVTAITGNGPTSEANARLYANAPKIITSLVGEVKRLHLELAAK